jgi:integrase
VWVFDGVVENGMAKRIDQLSALEVSRKIDKGVYADGGGLYLQVGKGGAKSWLFRYRFGLTNPGKPRIREMGLGSCDTFSLAEARQKATDCRKLLYDKIDPIEARNAERAAVRVETAKAMTFKDSADKYISSHSASWKNIKHGQQWTNTLATYVHPVIGNLPVQSIDIGLVMEILEPIWATKPETAGRVRGRIEMIIDWAKARGHFVGENPARWRGHLDKLLPARAKVQKVKHHAALPYADVGQFMAGLREQAGIGASGLEFLILTAARTGEVIGAEWNEIDMANRLWVIPAERMKADREHRVPLSDAAITVLERMRSVSQSHFVFPGGKANSPLSNMVFLQLLKRMGRGDLTAHGFRSTFRDWAAERTQFPNEVAEMALAHSVSNKVEAAYRRGDMFEKRHKLMASWAVFCSHIADEDIGNVVAMSGGK